MEFDEWITLDKSKLYARPPPNGDDAKRDSVAILRLSRCRHPSFDELDKAVQFAGHSYLGEHAKDSRVVRSLAEYALETITSEQEARILVNPSAVFREEWEDRRNFYVPAARTKPNKSVRLRYSRMTNPAFQLAMSLPPEKKIAAIERYARSIPTDVSGGLEWKIDVPMYRGFELASPVVTVLDGYAHGHAGPIADCAPALRSLDNVMGSLYPHEFSSAEWRSLKDVTEGEHKAGMQTALRETFGTLKRLRH